MSAWSAAIAAVATQLTPLQSSTVAVTGYEPGNPGWRRPLAITCSLGPLTPTEFGVTIRVYASTNTDVSQAQTDLTSLVESVEDTLGALTARSVWQTVWLADENAWQCSTVIYVPRDDF